jgi:hypothetical protein
MIGSEVLCDLDRGVRHITHSDSHCCGLLIDEVAQVVETFPMLESHVSSIKTKN